MKTRYINCFFVAALAMMGCFMTACEDQPDKYEIADTFLCYLWNEFSLYCFLENRLF